MSEFVKRAERILVDEGCLSPDETCRNQPGTEHYCHTCILDEALAAKDDTIDELRALLDAAHRQVQDVWCSNRREVRAPQGGEK